MTDDAVRLSIIVDSVRQGRLGLTVATWFASEALQRDVMMVDVLDLACTWLPEVVADGRAKPRAVAEVASWLAAADAFVVVTTEHSHSVPGSLKNAIDWFADEWKAKPVGLVTYGEASGGRSAVAPLRAVFAELHAVNVSTTLAFPDCASQFDADGDLTHPERWQAAAEVLLDELVWWATALRDARATRPYVS
jgi:NAD(P)H-dependent FMN reductase